VVVNNGPFATADLGRNMAQFCLYLYLLYVTIAAVSVPVVYRYFAICR
jgi:hypothetical protein